MAKRAKTIAVTPGSELDRLLAEAGGDDLLLERGSELFLIRRQEPWMRHEELSEEEYQRILDEVIGSWADLDTDKLVEDVYRWRREGSREPVED